MTKTRNADEIRRIGPHDLGGLDAGAVDREEHDLAHWERMVDAMVRLLLKHGVYADTAQLREGIEALGPDVYEDLTYYERWAASAARKCVLEGLVDRDELERRMTEIAQRGGGPS
jgi:hypothetical protein